jgi:hypothetical protein
MKKIEWTEFGINEKLTCSLKTLFILNTNFKTTTWQQKMCKN